MPYAITVPEGVVRRKYEQTASRDHDVTLVAGTYPLHKHAGSYWANIPAIARGHVSSTVEFGGVALASEQRGGEVETYTWGAYEYEIPKLATKGPFSFEGELA